MYTIKKLLILFFIGLQIIANAQVLDMHFISPIKDKSFEKNNVSCIAQDSIGYIWIGTEHGLYKFNGSNLLSYHFKVSDTTSLVDNNIIQLYVDKKGDLWIVTMFGICVYQKTYDNFKYIANEANFAGLESLQVSSIQEDQAGEIYVATGNTVYKYDKSVGAFHVFYKIGEGSISQFIFDNNNNLWIAALGNWGLTFYNPSENKVERFTHDKNNSNSISSNSVKDIVLQGNLLWIGTDGTGVNSFNLETRKFKRYSLPDSYAGYTLKTYVDKDNYFWSCDLTGIKLYDKQNDYFLGYYGNTDDGTSLRSSVTSFFQDRQGNYWVGYSPGGVDMRVVPKGFQKYSDNPGKSWHFSGNNITAIEFDSNGNWWLGNGFNGIDIFNWQTGEINTYHYDSSDAFSLGKGGVSSIYRDRNNTMWIGTNFGGLQYYDRAKDRFYSYKNDPNDSSSIANNDVRSIVEDKEGNLWIVVHGKGIDRFNTKGSKFYHYNSANNNLANDWAYQVLFDSEENLWVATAWGISKLLKGEETFETSFYLPNDSNTISSNVINCLFEDSKNQIWLGTTGGLCKYRSETNNYQRFYADLLVESINAIEEDTKGNLWMSTNDGIIKFNPETKEILSFDESDGLLGGIYHVRSVAKGEDNNLFFGGIDGMTVFDPADLKFNTEKPEVIITGFNLFYEPVNTYGNNSVLKKHISETDIIELNSDQNIIGFEFIATNFINAEKNRFKYKLEGVDKDWVDNANSNVANYTQLQPGRYTFRVIASNNDNVWNNKGASLEILINPPWWQTIWFKIIVLFSVVFVLYLVIRQRMAKLIRQKTQLEEMVLERTNTLNEKNILLEKRQLIIESQSEELIVQAEELRVTAEDIEEKNIELTKINETKDKLFSIIAHDLLNPFNVILGFTDSLIENFETWDEKGKLEVLNYVKDSSESAFTLLENLLHWSRSQEGMIDFNPVFIDASQTINSVLEEVSSFALKKEVEIVNLFNDKLLKVYADEDMFRLICRNLLMNAIKFSNPKTSVFINAEPDYKKSYIRFSVSDHGVGMEKEKADNLFNSANKSSTRGTKGEKGVGLGLILCLDFVKAHKGEIWVESQINRGTTIFFTIPKSVGGK